MLNKREGYISVDHRASPGMTEAQARWAGYDPKLAGEGKHFEAAGLTCSHCKTAVVKNPLRTRERASCAKCGFHYICDLCAFRATLSDYSHLPFEKMKDVMFEAVETGRLGALSAPLSLSFLKS
jgi:hypothetical protein